MGNIHCTTRLATYNNEILPQAVFMMYTLINEMNEIMCLIFKNAF